MNSRRKVALVLIFFIGSFGILIGPRISDHYKIEAQSSELKEMQAACGELEKRSINQMSQKQAGFLKKDFDSSEIESLSTVRNNLNTAIKEMTQKKYVNQDMFLQTKKKFESASLHVDEMLDAYELQNTLNQIFEEPVIIGDELSPNINQIGVNEELSDNQIERLAAAISSRQSNPDGLEAPVQELADSLTARLNSIGSPTDILESLFKGGSSQSTTEQQLADLLLQYDQGSKKISEVQSKEGQNNE